MSRFVPNSTMIPNAFIDDAMQHLSDKALRLYLIISRKTTGWGKDSDCISVSQFLSMSGMKDERSVKSGAKELIDAGLIQCIQISGKPTKYFLVGNVFLDVPPTYDVPPAPDAPPTYDVPNPPHHMMGVPPPCDVPHKINNKTTNTRTITTANAVVKKPASRKAFLMPHDWTPSDRCKDLLARAGIGQDFYETLVDEFVLYWEERQEARTGWETTFLNHAKRQWAQKSPGDGSGQNQGFSKTNGGNSTAKANMHGNFRQKDYGETIVNLPGWTG